VTHRHLLSTQNLERIDNVIGYVHITFARPLSAKVRTID
jgi:hypothetical protein